MGGVGRGTKNFLMLTLGTGVGGGMVLNGKLYTGSHNIGAEIGHTTFKAGGAQCYPAAPSASSPPACPQAAR